MLSLRATWSPPLAKTFFFARHTLSQMSQAALGLILEAVPESLFTQLPWFFLPKLSFSDMSVCRSCKVWAVKVALLVDNRWSGSDAGPLQDGMLCMYEANWASQALTRVNHNKACCPVFGTKRLPGASSMLFVAACLQKKISVLPSRSFVPISRDFSLEQVGIDISCPCTHESNSLNVNTAKNARSSRKVEEDKVTLCGVPSSCNA